MLQAKRQGRRWPRRRILRWLAVGTAGIVVVAILAAIAFTVFLGRTFDSTRHTIADPFPAVRPPKPVGAAAHASNILLLGQDADAVDGEHPHLVGRQQADTLMVLHIPADRKHVYVISILRYSDVPIPGHGSQAVNTALAYGGIPLEVRTVEQLLGVRFDHVVSADLAGLKDLTDALGGVTVRNPVSFENGGYRFAAGTQRLDGAKALAYVRSGAHGATGDVVRARAQTAYFTGLVGDVFRARTLLNPAALATTVSVVAPFLTVDKGFDSAYVADLGVGLRDLRAADVKTFTLPAPHLRQVGTAHVLEVDRAALERVREHLRTDTLDQILG